MKKIILSGILSIIIIHVILFCSSINYFSPSGTFGFYEVIAEDMSDFDGYESYYSTDDQYKCLFTAPELDAVLSACEFEAVSFVKAFSVAARSRNAEQIITLLWHGKRTTFYEKSYFRGRLLFFDDGSVYYGVSYLSDDGFTFSLFKVNATQELLDNYKGFINNTDDKNMLVHAMKNYCWNYAVSLKEPYAFVPQIVVVVVCFGLWIIKRQKTNINR